eukprot:scaffold1829_cov194-Ochromonas_danica.AAC.24
MACCIRLRSASLILGLADHIQQQEEEEEEENTRPLGVQQSFFVGDGGALIEDDVVDDAVSE